MQKNLKQAVKEKYDLIISVGGDGTLNQISSELIGTKVALALFLLDQETAGLHFGIKKNMKQLVSN